MTHIALSTDGKVLATGSDDRTAKVWDAQTGELRQMLEGHSGEVNSVALSADGKVLATGSKDGTAAGLGQQEEGGEGVIHSLNFSYEISHAAKYSFVH